MYFNKYGSNDSDLEQLSDYNNQDDECKCSIDQLIRNSETPEDKNSGKTKKPVEFSDLSFRY